ncbi:MAG TPA: asparagine synthase (glutamine-hydrolyzing) [candidate division Zixibacteria bacterium]|nr:asparagine synthase (glutamine-hydrolyzing) [candidate division Zixibacteria bacterium]
MCGIAGYFRLVEPGPPDHALIQRMVGAIRHRGPDEFGAYFSDRCGLGQARLSIIDLAGGSQPLANEDNTLWITFNGEIFNYLELRGELVAAGHRFRTQSDTEVIVHAYEEWGTGCLDRFNGQFAFVIYDSRKQQIFAARDRLGIRPLFYADKDGVFYFASEIKSIFCRSALTREIDPIGLDQIFTWWTTAPPRTAFKGINELAAGQYLTISDGKIRVSSYWSQSFPTEFDFDRSLSSWAEELQELLIDSVRLRLRADVPVGAYLSGGLDSSATTALIKHFTDTPVETFSIAFHDQAYDESGYQKQMAEYLGTRHHQIQCDYGDIAANFPKAIWHAERPIVRTAPTPLLMLSALVRQNNFKVVLTGEGSDEMLGGYDIFKETMIRRFWARNPDSSWRPLLLRRLYPTLPLSPARARFYLETFYKKGLTDINRYYYSHQQRINTTQRIKDLFCDEFRNRVGESHAVDAFGIDLPEEFPGWHHLCRAQYLEARSLLAGYLLSSQGDRVSAAHAVEGRYPFLDHRVAEFASKIPPWYKLMGLKEKMVLKKAMSRELPREIIERVKQPYMAPDSNSFFRPGTPEYVDTLLSAEKVAQAGIFAPDAVEMLRAKCVKLSHAHLSFKDNMSFIGVLSTQLLWSQYIDNFTPSDPVDRKDYRVWLDETS